MNNDANHQHRVEEPAHDDGPVSIHPLIDLNKTAATSVPIITAHIDQVHRPDASTWHDHDQHELLWSAGGSFQVQINGRSWQVLPGTAVWVPTGIKHRTSGKVGYSCGWALVQRSACPPLWNQITSVTISPLLFQLLAYLSTDLFESDRVNAESVALDLLHHVLAQTAIELPVPNDDRCRQIAERILQDPACPWELSDWATEVGASVRTLSRLFQAETSMSFSQWRTHARIRAAVADLADGLAVASVAKRVGYRSSSAFITAFRRATGRTPTTYLPSSSPVAQPSTSRFSAVV